MKSVESLPLDETLLSQLLADDSPSRAALLEALAADLTRVEGTALAAVAASAPITAALVDAVAERGDRSAVRSLLTRTGTAADTDVALLNRSWLVDSAVEARLALLDAPGLPSAAKEALLESADERDLMSLCTMATDDVAALIVDEVARRTEPQETWSSEGLNKLPLAARTLLTESVTWDVLFGLGALLPKTASWDLSGDHRDWQAHRALERRVEALLVHIARRQVHLVTELATEWRKRQAEDADADEAGLVARVRNLDSGLRLALLHRESGLWDLLDEDHLRFEVDRVRDSIRKDQQTAALYSRVSGGEPAEIVLVEYLRQYTRRGFDLDDEMIEWFSGEFRKHCEAGDGVRYEQGSAVDKAADALKLGQRFLLPTWRQQYYGSVAAEQQAGTTWAASAETLGELRDSILDAVAPSLWASWPEPSNAGANWATVAVALWKRDAERLQREQPELRRKLHQLAWRVLNWSRRQDPDELTAWRTLQELTRPTPVIGTAAAVAESNADKAMDALGDNPERGAIIALAWKSVGEPGLRLDAILARDAIPVEALLEMVANPWRDAQRHRVTCNGQNREDLVRSVLDSQYCTDDAILSLPARECLNRPRWTDSPLAAARVSQLLASRVTSAQTWRRLLASEFDSSGQGAWASLGVVLERSARG